MQTVGLVKCKQKKLKYSNKTSKDTLINLNNLNIKQISSIIINANIVTKEFLKDINSLKILIKINLKIIYSKYDDNLLYVCDKSLLELAYIEMPKNLDGVDTNFAFIKNKIKYDLFIENLSYKIINKDLLLVNFYILTNLKVSPSFSVAYCINNNFFDNLFVSYYDGDNLTQQTFTSDLEYSNVNWQTNGSNIIFTGCKENTYYINVLDYNCKSVNKVNSVKLNNPVNSICFMNPNTLILSLKEEDKDVLYTYNLKENALKKYKHTKVSENFTNPYFNKKLNTLFCLCKINELNCLCSIDKQSNVSILFNFANVDNFVINEEVNKVFIKVLKEEQLFFYTMDLDSKNITPINFDFSYDKILKIKYLNDKNLDEILVIFYVYNDRYYLSIYNLKELSSNIIYDDSDIIDFDINLNNLDIFVIVANDIFSQVIKIEEDYQSEILKIPSTIKSVSIK